MASRFFQHVFSEKTLWEELPHVNDFLLHHSHESNCQELLIDALRRMSFRKLLDLRLRNIDNFLVSLLWETCSLTRDGGLERSLSVYVSVPLTASNTWRPSICVSGASTVRVGWALVAVLLALWSAVLLRAVVRRRWHRHGD